MITLFKTITGLLLLQTLVAYDGDDLQAEPSQDSFSSSVNSILLQQGQPFSVSSGSFSNNVNGQRSGGSFVNNNGQVAFTPGRQTSYNGGNVGGYGNSADVGGDYQIYNTGNIRADLPAETPYWWVANNSPFTAAKVAQGGAVNCVSDNECYDNKGRLVAMVYEPNTNFNRNYKNGNDNVVVGKSDYSQNPFLNGDYAAVTNNKVAVRRQSPASNFGGFNTNSQLLPSDSGAFASNQVLSVGGSVGGQQPVAYYTAEAVQRNNAFAPNGNSQQFSSQSAYAGIGSGFVKASSFVDEPKQYLPPVPTPQPCNGRGQACVPSQQCQNGYIGQAQYAALGSASNNQNCNPNFEVCCTIEVPQTQRPVVPSTYRPTQPPQTYRPTQRPTPPPQTQRPYYDTTKAEYLPPATNRPTQAPQRPTQPRPTQPRPTQPRPTQPRPTQPRPTPPAPKPCAVNGNACVTPQLCRSGSINSNAVPRGSSSTGQCPAPNVCCRIQVENNNQYLPPIDGDASNNNNNYLATSTTTTEKPERDYEFNPSDDNSVVLRPTQPPRTPRPTPPRVFDNDASNNVNLFIPVGCPAAMNCTQVEFCTAQAVISKTQVVLTPQQQEFRVPMTDCRDLEKGFVGKCCRDPDYTDPWPVGQLGQYNEEAFGFKPERSQKTPNRPRTGESELSRPRPSNEPTLTATTNQFLSRVPSPQQPSASSTSNQFRTPQQNSIPTVTKTFQPPRPTVNIATSTFGSFDQVPGSSGVCGVRNYDNVPRGAGPFDTAFGEFPWQAMVLLESNKSLLCGGAITDKNMVVTAAHCVNGLRPYDVLIKAGEWRLGSDEEPKPFQLVRVKKIMMHPAYQPTNLNYDVALLELENNLNYDNHIEPICIDDAELDTSATSNCVTTGWGKNVLKVHISNALMHQSPCTIKPQSECESALSGYGFNPDSSYCGQTQDDACDLDAGSALACENSAGKYVIKGVYSSETECGSPSQLVTFTKMDFSWVKTMSQPGTGFTSQPNRLYQTAASSLTTGQNQYLPPV